MFHKRSLAALALLAAMAIVVLVFGTALGTPSNVKEASDAASAIPAQSERYAELKRIQLERKDAELYGGFAAVPVRVRPKSYDELKDAQLEQIDAIQFGSTIRPAPIPDLPEIERQIQAQDSRLGQWFGNSTKAGCYLVPKTPDGTVEC